PGAAAAFRRRRRRGMGCRPGLRRNDRCVRRAAGLLKGASMIHLKVVRLDTIDAARMPYFPFNVPAIRSFAGTEIAFSSEVTFLIGENGSGKSTFLEALACAARSITVGS